MRLYEITLILLLSIISFGCAREFDVIVQKNSIIVIEERIIIHFGKLKNLKLLKTSRTSTGRLIYCKDSEHEMNLEIALIDGLMSDSMQSLSIKNDTLMSDVDLLRGEGLYTSELIVNEGIIGRNNCKYLIVNNEFVYVYEKELYFDKDTIKLRFKSSNKYCNIIVFNMEMKKILDKVEVIDYGYEFNE